MLGSPHLHPCAAASYATPYTNRPFPQCSAGSFAEKSGCRDGARRAECLNLLGSAQICLNLLQHAQTCSSPLSYAGYSHSFRLIPHTLHPLFRSLRVFLSVSAGSFADKSGRVLVHATMCRVCRRSGNSEFSTWTNFEPILLQCGIYFR